MTMSRQATIHISLTPQQLRLVRARVDSGRYGSASKVIRESLQMLLQENRSTARPSVREQQRDLIEGYKATAALDRRLAQEWTQLEDAWPAK
jgi:putative addiction module CopG family antidote